MMPTIQEIITKVDELRPNRFSNDLKIGWCADVDIAVKNDLLPGVEDIDYTAADRELLVPKPYSRLYGYYLMAQISYHNDEMESYNNDMMQFNSAWDEYAKYLQRTRASDNLKIINYM